MSQTIYRVLIFTDFRPNFLPLDCPVRHNRRVEGAHNPGLSGYGTLPRSVRYQFKLNLRVKRLEPGSPTLWGNALTTGSLY